MMMMTSGKLKTNYIDFLIVNILSYNKRGKTNVMQHTGERSPYVLEA